MSTFFLRDPAGREYPIGTLTNIGREQTCQIIMDDPSVSRIHATVWEQQGALYVRDENSRNGTFVGDAKVASAQPTPLRVGDQLRVGSITFSVMSAQVPVGAPSTQPVPATPTLAVALPGLAQPSKSKTPLILGCVAFIFLGIIGFCVLSLGGLAILGSGSSIHTPTIQAIATTAPIVQQLPTAATISVPVSPPPSVTPTIAPPTVAPPTVTPTPTGTPTVGKITIAENVTDAGEVINPTNIFPAGTTKVYAYFTYANMKSGDVLGRKWLRDGKVDLEKTEAWNRGGTGSYYYYLFYESGKPLDSGNYEFILYLGGKEVQRAAFTIGRAGAAPPPSAPTTPLNACPPNPYYVRLVNELSVGVTINLSGPRTYRIVLPVGGTRDTCFVAGTYSSLLSASGFKDTTETKTFAATTGTPECWWFYPGSSHTTSCTAPTDLRLYSPPDAAGAAASSDAINVFFTIQNGSPTGYVIDKQGNRYTPPGYLTISGFHVNVGDRIVIQTDQPRFSMLFDCGTTPQIYSPCDFIAGVPSNLPAEIRKTARGTAFLNISRADNWAGTRPGFPNLRYPAEPVLRIMLGD